MSASGPAPETCQPPAMAATCRPLHPWAGEATIRVPGLAPGRAGRADREEVRGMELRVLGAHNVESATTRCV